MDNFGLRINEVARPVKVDWKSPSVSGYGEISPRDDDEDPRLGSPSSADDGINHRKYPNFQRVSTDVPDDISRATAEAPSSHRDVHPERSTHPLLRPLLFWINPLIYIARTGNAAEQDIWNAPDDAGVAFNASRVLDAWRKEQEAIEADCVNGDSYLFTKYFRNMWLRIPPFGRAILLAYRHDILVGALYQFCFAALQLTLPFIIGNVIAYLNGGSGDISYGVGMVFALGIVSAFSSYAIILTFYNMRRSGVCIKAGVMMATYQHALRLSVAARQSCSVGQTTNLMSIDCDKIAMASQYLHFLW
jgi:hypothetical protein